LVAKVFVSPGFKMNIVIVRKLKNETKSLIAGLFPEDWRLVFVSSGELEAAIEDADVLIPENEIVKLSLLDKAKSLKLIQTGAGYDNVPIEACTQKGIYVANAAGINAQAVAEHVFAFILSWYKNIVYFDSMMKAGKYRINYIGSELSQKVIGIVGIGNIGKEIARMARAFKMNVIGYHYRQIETGSAIEMVDMQSLLKLSDVITLHVRLTNHTRHMIGQNEIELMKKDAFLINTSRGAVLDETALIEALKNKKIGGAGLDVFEEEPLPDNSPLRKLKNVILTPHTAGEPDGLYFHFKRFKFFAENIMRVSRGKAPKNVLNQMDVMDTP
jgi:phosphoglycerate dehydrogenase-like enzyme